jgi:hypothetical protein
MSLLNRQHSLLPGFGLAFGVSLFWLGLIVILPFAALLVSTGHMGLNAFLNTVLDPRVLASIRLSFVTALFAALINALFGLLVAWVLVRYSFPGRRLFDPACTGGVGERAGRSRYLPGGQPWANCLAGDLAGLVAGADYRCGTGFCPRCR